MDVTKAKFIDVNGINTRYFESGSGDPMVLIHGAAAGNSSSAEVWSTNFDELAKKYHVYAFDKLGQGHTDNPKINEDYFMGGQVKHAADFMETLGISNAHLIGHSRGGYMVTRIALEYPNLAKSITDLKEKTHYSLTQNSFGTEHITDEWIAGILDYTSSSKFKEAQSKATELYPMFLDDLENKQSQTHSWIKAGKLKVPTLVIWSIYDPSAIWNPIGINCLNLILPNVENSSMYIFNKSGHYAFREQPEEFNSVINSFISTKANL
jgi:2-hydroxy-6-oxonona-2,4-dienedioate hydrolase